MLSNRIIIFYKHWEYQCCPIETSFLYTLGISMLSNRNIFFIYIGNINVVQLKHLFIKNWEYQCSPIEISFLYADHCLTHIVFFIIIVYSCGVTPKLCRFGKINVKHLFFLIL